MARYARWIGMGIVGGTLWLTASAAGAQPIAPASPPSERIGIFAADVRFALPSLAPSDAIATPRGLKLDQLPERGLGFDLGAHVYPLRWKNGALGIGATMLFGRGRKPPADPVEGQPPPNPEPPTVETRIRAITPQVSLNFGRRQGWSYISGGIGTMTREIERSDTPAATDDPPRVRTINYGGGARWFVSDHLAVSFDLRFYRVGAQSETVPDLPNQSLFVISAGISLK